MTSGLPDYTGCWPSAGNSAGPYVAGTLLAQTGDPFVAGALGAFVHGRAAERVVTAGGARGISLDDVVRELRHAWDFSAAP